MRLKVVFAIFLFCSGGLSFTQQQPDGLQFNVPYLCNDGKTYVVHRCEKGPKFEACFYQHEPDSERYNTREAVVYQMTKMCKVGGPPSASLQAPQRPADYNNSRWDCGGGTGMTVIGCERQRGGEACFVRLEQGGKVIAQAAKPLNEIQSNLSACKALPALNPGYVAEFPSPMNVVLGMLVGKPQDNVTRAIGAFYQLSEIIKVLAGSRALSVDETKLLNDYAKAQAELVKQAESKFPGQRFDPESNPFRFKRSDPKFGFEGIPVWTTFLTRGTQDAYAHVVGGSDDRYAVAVNREKQIAIHQVDDQMKAQQAEASYAKDPGSVAARHCVESGRSEMECLGEGIKVGLNDLMGGDPVKGLIPETPTGLRMTGVYSAGNFGLVFHQDVVMVRCGTLIPQNLTYTVSRSGMQIAVEVPVSPRHLVLSYRDGRLAGPPAIDVNGLVPIGGARDTTSTSYEMQTQTTTTQRQIDAADVANYNADQVHQNGMEYSVDQQSASTSWSPTATHHYEVPTAPKTEHCNVGSMQATGETGSASGLLTQVVGSKASKSANTAPGLRLNGKYAVPDGMKIEFRDDSATLECGESFNSEAYSVLPQGGQLIVKFDNSTGPLSLVLEPNGTLTGTGNIEVAGRRAIQGNGGGLDYLARKATCALGTLRAAK